MSASPRGPRTDRPDLRATILQAARERFGEGGFVGTSLRSIATSAGVDVALIPYYFGNKAGLYTATLELQLDPRAKLEAVFAAGPDGVGERLARTILQLLEDEATRSVFLSLIRSAVTEGPARQAVRTLVDDVILAAYEEHLAVPDARERASLAATQILGVAMARHVVGIEPLASMPVEEVVAHIGPTLQRYLTGDHD
jgi:AcrR family transcriptional regulator